MNSIVIGNLTFSDASIIDVELNLTKAPIGESLAIDTCEFTLTTNNGSTLMALPYGTPINYYHNSNLVGIFYLQNESRIDKNKYRFECVSAMGIIDNITCKGGIYSTTPAKNIVADILHATYVSGTDPLYYEGDIDYYITKEVADIPMTGWLPYSTSARESLRQVMFALGSSVLKNADGIVRIAFWQPTEATQIADSRVYNGGTVTVRKKVTKVIVSEHEFRATSLDKKVELYNTNGDTVSNKLVLFTNPCHDLTATGVTIVESGSNYAIISGLGKLEGYEYTHTIALVEKTTGATGIENIETIEDAYLVSALNSLNVAERVSAYCGGADFENFGIKLQGDITLGDRLQFTDPYGNEKTGYIAEAEVNGSAILKADSKLITNWQPNHVGNTYNHYTILSAGGTWNVPASLQGKPARVIVFGGFEGGQGGYKGADGEQKSYYDRQSEGGYTFVPVSKGGAGGQGGQGGTTVNINVLNIASLGASYTYTVGTGGAGGNANGGSGSLGTDSTFNGVSSASGVVNTEGYANPITGEIYGGRADSGLKGGDGGDSGRNGYGNGNYLIESGTNGQSVGSGVGGLAGGGGGHIVNQWDIAYGSGAGGGGAVDGHNGQNGWAETGQYVGGDYYYYPRAGNGASYSSADNMPQAELGHNGKGGGGSGGGGGAGSRNVYGSDWATGGRGRAGASGQNGQQGSGGFILVLHD